MARGLPAVWSMVFGTPFVVGGGWIYLEYDAGVAPREIGLPVAAFGLFIVLFGFYVHFIAAPDPPSMRDHEEVRETRYPAQRATLTKSFFGLGLILVAEYLLFFTFLPYIYPIAPFVIGLYLFSTGIHSYWTNTLTTYYVTDHRLIKEYRFVSLVRQEIPLNQVRGVEERRSVWETLVGLGNVRVATGGGSNLEIVVRNIYSPTGFADEVRRLH